MKDLHRGIMTLIRSAITGEALPLPEGFSVEEACDLIKKHQVVGLAYEGAVKCGIPKSLPVMQELFQLYYVAMIRSTKQMQALDQMFAAFEEKGIDYMPVKGCNLKKLYPKPEMRIMGDADILIRMEQYEQIKSIMESLGYAEGAETNHELVWKKPELYVELHKRLIGTVDQDYFQYLQDGWQRAQHQQGTHYSLALEDEYIYLFIHYAKHYRKGGIGIRQPIDLWVWQRAYSLDMDYVRGELDKINMLEFFDNTQQMLRIWFEGAPDAEKALFMSDYIFNSGSWGNLESTQLGSSLRAEHLLGSRKKQRARQMWLAIFPPVSFMSIRYPILKKMPWLLPVFWPVRWVSAVLFRKNNIHDFYKSTKNTSTEKRDSFQDALRYVGLEFDF